MSAGPFPDRKHRRFVTGVCSSGKRGFPERRGAKEAARHVAKTAGGDKPRAYLCDDCGYWHMGHLPDAVMRGEISAAGWYDEGGAPTDLPARGEGPCMDCGTLDTPVWSAPNDLWNRVVGSDGGYLCPWCFTVRADRVIGPQVWDLRPRFYERDLTEERP